MKKTYINRIDVGSGGAASVSFTSIPQGYDGLYILVSDRSNRAATNDALIMKLNGTTSTGKRIYGSGSSASSTSNPDPLNGADNDESGLFSNIQFTIPRYASTDQYKSWSSEGVETTDGAAAYQSVTSGFYQSNNAVSSIEFTVETGTGFIEGSSFTIYGYIAGSDETTTVS